MSDDKLVKHFMIDIFSFPHIPYWFTLKQAMGIIKKVVYESDESTDIKPVRPIMVMVFDEKYQFLGTLTHINILHGLLPQFLKPAVKAQVLREDEDALSVLWDTLFESESKTFAQKPVKDVMVPVNQFVTPDDPMSKAAYKMLHHNLILLPVLDEKKKLTGVIRMIEIFDELTDIILEERRK